MASSGATVRPTGHSPVGVQIKSKEDINRVLAQIQKREAMVQTLQKKLALKGAALNKAEKKLKKRSDFLDAWEVSLKSKEAELVDEREEVERLKATLKKVAEQIMGMSSKTGEIYETDPFEEEYLEEEAFETKDVDKKSFLSFLRGKSKKSTHVAKPPPISERLPAEKKTLREVLEAKREKLKSVPLEETSDEAIEDLESLIEEDEVEEIEIYTCPVCDGEVALEDSVCEACGAELNWGT